MAQRGSHVMICFIWVMPSCVALHFFIWVWKSFWVGMVRIKQCSHTSSNLAHFLSGQIQWTFCRPANLRKTEVFRGHSSYLGVNGKGRKCLLLFGLCFLSLAKNYKLMGLINDSLMGHTVQQFGLNEAECLFCVSLSKIFSSWKAASSPFTLGSRLYWEEMLFE